jgi:YD repeat-containing protein
LLVPAICTRATYTYDATGDIATIKDALGHVTAFTGYDAEGRPLSASPTRMGW